MESPALRLDETSERGRVHKQAIRQLLMLVPKGSLCFWDAKGIGDKRSGVFAEPLINTRTLGIYHQDNLPHPVSFLPDAVGALYRSMLHGDCPIPTEVVVLVQQAKIDLAKELAHLQAQFATPATDHFIESEIDDTGLLLRHTHTTRDRHNSARRKVDVNLTAAIGPLLYWVQQNQTALHEYLETGYMPSHEKQLEYRLESFKVQLLNLSLLIEKGLLQHGVDLAQVPLTDTTLTFQRRDVMCEGRSGVDHIQSMIAEWLQCLTRIVELEPDFLPEEWRAPFLIARGKAVKPHAPEAGYRDCALPSSRPVQANLHYMTTSFYGVHILRWMLRSQDSPLSEQRSEAPAVQPPHEPKPTVTRKLIGLLLKLVR